MGGAGPRNVAVVGPISYCALDNLWRLHAEWIGSPRCARKALSALPDCRSDRGLSEFWRGGGIPVCMRFRRCTTALWAWRQ